MGSESFGAVEGFEGLVPAECTGSGLLLGLSVTFAKTRDLNVWCTESGGGDREFVHQDNTFPLLTTAHGDTARSTNNMVAT